MPLLRLIAVALLVSGSAVAFGLSALAEPLDKQSCASLQVERNKLLTRDMQAALDRDFYKRAHELFSGISAIDVDIKVAQQV